MNNVYNLQIELEIERRLLHRLRRQRQLILNRQTPVGYPEGQSYLDADTIPGRGSMGFTDILKELDELEREINKTLKNIECLERDIQEIKYLVNSLTGLEQKVKYMQLIEGKSLREIARLLNYNYGYIRNIVNKK